MKMLIRGAIVIVLMVGLMGPSHAQGGNIVATNSVQSQPKPAEEKSDRKPVDWFTTILTLVAGGGVTLFVTHVTSFLKSRHESKKELQEFLRKWAIEDTVEPILHYLELLNVHVENSKGLLQLEPIPTISIIALHRLQLLTGTKKVLELLIILTPIARNPLTKDEGVELTSIINDFGTFLLELECFLMDYSLNNRSSIMFLHHHPTVKAVLPELESISVRFDKFLETYSNEYNLGDS